MKLDPEIRVASLLAAIPSSQVAFNRLQISLDGNQGKTLQQICSDNGIEFDQFLSTLKDIDWNREGPLPGAGQV